MPRNGWFSAPANINARQQVEDGKRRGDVLSYDEWLSLVKRKGWKLRDVPVQFYTKEMLLAAVNSFGKILEIIPSDWAWSENPPHDVPKDWMDNRSLNEIYLVAVNNSGWALKYVRRNMLTEEMCFAAIYKDPNALQFVPLEMQTDQMYLAAVSRNGSTLRYVPYEKRSLMLCKIAYANMKFAEDSIPDDIKIQMGIGGRKVNTMIRKFMNQDLNFSLRVPPSSAQDVAVKDVEVISVAFNVIHSGVYPAEIDDKYFISCCYIIARSVCPEATLKEAIKLGVEKNLAWQYLNTLKNCRDDSAKFLKFCQDFKNVTPEFYDHDSFCKAENKVILWRMDQPSPYRP